MGILPLIGAAVPWRVIGISAGALAMGSAILLYMAQAKRIERLEEERAAAVASAASSARLLQIQSEESARILAALDKASGKKTTVHKAAENERRRVFNAPPSDDGSLAPILRRQLDELPKRAGADFYSNPETTDTVRASDAK